MKRCKIQRTAGSGLPGLDLNTPGKSSCTNPFNGQDIAIEANKRINSITRPKKKNIQKLMSLPNFIEVELNIHVFCGISHC